MGESRIQGGSNKRTNTTAIRFTLRSVLLRASRARVIIASALSVSLLAVVGYVAYAADSPSQGKVESKTDNTSTADNANGSAIDGVSGGSSTVNNQSNNSMNVGKETNKATVQITVNGKTVSVPANGNYNHSSDDGDTQTNINVENHSSSSSEGNNASNSSSSSLKINVNN